MKKRGFILIWPLLVAPIAAIVTVWLSGPTYTTAPNQGAMVVRFLGLVTWLAFSCLGCLLTPLIMKTKNKEEWIVSIGAGAASIFVFYAISTEMK
jgi:uncharacterized membrane protein YqiK